MRAVLALLLGLLTIAIASDADDDTSGEEFSWDSSDAGTTDSYNGLVVQVYNPTDGEPVITLGTDQDNHESTYCLTLIRVFEATGYDFSDPTSEDTEVTDSSVDLSDASCEVAETSTTTFTIDCNDVRGANLSFAFSFVTNSDGDEGLEYTITLEDYVFVQDDAQLVLVQSVKECSDLYAYSADSGDDSVSEESVEETDDTTVRRLSDGDETDETDDDETDDEETEDDDTSDSADEESGISSDDSDEFDTGYAQFIVNGQAYDDCDGTQTAIDSALQYDEDEKELSIIFAHFDCTLFIDPYVGVDGSKITTSGANGVYVMTASFIGLIGALLF